MDSTPDARATAPTATRRTTCTKAPLDSGTQLTPGMIQQVPRTRGDRAIMKHSSQLHLLYRGTTATWMNSTVSYFLKYNSSLKKNTRYQTCKECSLNRISQTRPANECSQANLFENFYPNSYLQADFLQFNDTDIMVVVCTLTGFGKAFKTKNKGTEEAIKVMRAWISQWGRPLELTHRKATSMRKDSYAR